MGNLVESCGSNGFIIDLHTANLWIQNSIQYKSLKAISFVMLNTHKVNSDDAKTCDCTVHRCIISTIHTWFLIEFMMLMMGRILSYEISVYIYKIGLRSLCTLCCSFNNRENINNDKNEIIPKTVIYLTFLKTNLISKFIQFHMNDECLIHRTNKRVFLLRNCRYEFLI